MLRMACLIKCDNRCGVSVADYQEFTSLLLFTEHYQMSVLESAPVSSTVGRVFAKDLDEGINAEMKYTIVDGDGADAFDINTDPNFQVGIITVKKVIGILFPNHLFSKTFWL